jgi:hypothetical protein
MSSSISAFSSLRRFAGTVLSSFAVCILLTLPLLSTARAQDQSGPPLSVPFHWGHVQIVGGGFITGIVGHSLDSDLRYARTDIGGTYRWDAGTKRWKPLMQFLNDAQFNYIGTEAIGLDPNNTQTLYIAAGTYTESFEGNGAILVSHDQGRHFTIVPLPIKLGSNDAGRSAGERLVVDPNNGSNIYFGSRDNGLWFSHDYGLHWSQLPSFPVKGPTGTTADPGVGVIFGYFDRKSGIAAGGGTKTGYFGVSDPNVGLYVTNDGGQSFSPVPGQPAGMYPNSMSSDPNGNLYIAYGHSSSGNSVGPYSMNSGAIWKFAPGSGTTLGVWTNITPPNPNGESYGFGSVAVDQANPNIIMVSTMDRYYPPPQDDIFRSIDGGKTWKSLETNSVRDASLSPWVTFGAPNAQAGNWINHLWINPANGNEVLYGDGQTIWQTFNVSSADTVLTNPSQIVVGGVTNWSIGALGVEQTAVDSLISPTAGPAHLISGMGDLSGFTHTTLRRSPPQGADIKPNIGTGASLDFASLHPLTVVRVGNSKPFGAYSTDGGITFAGFASSPSAVSSGSGTVALTADGGTILWAPSDAGAQIYYSADGGNTWIAATGSPVSKAGQSAIIVVSDRIDPETAYVYNPATGILYTSNDSGRSFTAGPTLIMNGNLQASTLVKGDLWLSGGGTLQHSINGGRTFTMLSNVTSAQNFGFGAPFPFSKIPTIYMRGSIDHFPSDYSAFFASVDYGRTWFQINDEEHQYGNASVITGDPRVFGRVYIATNGFGIVEGDLGW